MAQNPLNIPVLDDPAEFRHRLRRLFCRPDASLDTEAAAAWSDVDPTTVRRWCRGSTRIPKSVLMLVYLLTGSPLPAILGDWHGWSFRRHYDLHRKMHIVELVDETGNGYKAGELRSLLLQQVRIQGLQTRIRELERQIQDGLTLPQRSALEQTRQALNQALSLIDALEQSAATA